MFSSGSLRSFANYRKPGLCGVVHRWCRLQPEKKETGRKATLCQTEQLGCSAQLGAEGAVPDGHPPAIPTWDLGGLQPPARQGRLSQSFCPSCAL